jgi:hypothetical protein
VKSRPALTPRQLNRATLDRQLLLRRRTMDVTDAVRRVLALQAQEPASPYLALWNRITRFDPADLDAAFVNRSVVKASLIRLTLHAVASDDWPAMYDALAPSLRESRVFDDRFTSGGVDAAAVDAFLPDLVRALRRPTSGERVQALIEERFGAGGRQVWWAMRRFAPLQHAPTGHPWSFGRPAAFVAGQGRLRRPDPAASARWLLLRYLQAFGPATAEDSGLFTILRMPVIRPALEALQDAGEIRPVDVPGRSTLFDLVGGRIPSGDVAAPPRLLGMWDNVLLAYADRSRVVPEPFRAVVFRRNGDVLPTLLVDGEVAGVWQPVDGAIEATAFRRLDDAAWAGLAKEARGLLRFLGSREPEAYRRYGHWWGKDMPRHEVRLLPG